MFAKTIKISALVLVVLTIIFTLIYQCNPSIVILSTAITFGTIWYYQTTGRCGSTNVIRNYCLYQRLNKICH